MVYRKLASIRFLRFLSPGKQITAWLGVRDQMVGHDHVHDVVSPAARHVAGNTITRRLVVSCRMARHTPRPVVRCGLCRRRLAVRIVAAGTKQPALALGEAA